VSFTTDIPSFGAAWGKPFLIGPGSIHAAHTAEDVDRTIAAAITPGFPESSGILWRSAGKQGIGAHPGGGVTSASRPQRRARDPQGITGRCLSRWTTC